MKKNIFIFVYLIALCFDLHAQLSVDELHGDQNYLRTGLHNGNQIRTSFRNDGEIGFTGDRPTTTDYNMEWPVNSSHAYATKIILLPMAEVRDANGIIQHIVSESHATGFVAENERGDIRPDGSWQTMCPLPGFFNAALGDSASPALSDLPNSWPMYWPDKMKDEVDPGWPGQWNGYFGKGPSKADQESYFMADDYNNDEFNYYPDENHLNRRGLGLRIAYRYMQWANPMVQDVMFMIYDIENIGSKALDKVNFAMLPDIDCGPIIHDWDNSMDQNVFEKEEDWFYIYDQKFVNSGQATFFTPVAYGGYALFETPGNEFDGIDNDQDGESGKTFGSTGTGITISVDDFNRGLLSNIDTVIIIDYTNYERSKKTLEGLKQSDPSKFSGDTLVINFIGRPQKFWQGKELVEVPFNNFDDNLNGLIDENNGAEIEGGIFSYVYEGNLAINYFTGEGSDNPMIDESRKDGIDNDKDWNFLNDLGVDGLAGTGDYGEGDGEATSKYQWIGDSLVIHDGPGEEHIDAVDITESDQIGMTSYFSTQEWTSYLPWMDQVLWDITVPGIIDGVSTSGIEVNFMGSGYFPLTTRQIERFSGAIMFNYKLDGLRRTKDNAQRAYDGNYQFYKAPERPTLHAVPGNGKVTLYWDDLAEKSVDPLLGEDFEGYRIYRSTGEKFLDMDQITDAYGEPTYLVPIAQFDLENGITGISPGSIDGIQFYLGNDTGLEHEWVDTTVVNGQRYFYYISSYDHGDPVSFVSPTECNKNIQLDMTTGDVISMSSNVAVVTPNAQSAGYKVAPSDVPIELVEGFTTSKISLSVFDSPAIKGDNTYHVSFEDTVIKIPSLQKVQLMTKNISITNVTTNEIILDRFDISKQYTNGEPIKDLPVLEGFKLTFYDQKIVQVDTASAFDREGLYKPAFETFYKGTVGKITADDYLIEFGEVGIDTSTAFKPDIEQLKSIPVNFTITNLSKNKKIKFAFDENDPFPPVAGEEGKFSYFSGRFARTDEIYFLEEDKNGDLVTTWKARLVQGSNPADTLNPGPGDKLNFITLKPALSRDVFEFTTVAESFDKNAAKEEMQKIKIVPNPYIVSNSWERANPYSTGRGPRELHFTHLPPKCTINIFDIAGQHVAKIEREVISTVDGTQVWNMQTKDGLEIGFGVYIYHVNAPGIGQKTGKFAVIK